MLMLTNSPQKLPQRNSFLTRREGATISRSGKTCPLSKTRLKGWLCVRSTCLRKVTSVSPAWVVCPSSPACNLRLQGLEAVSMTSGRKPQILKVSSQGRYSLLSVLSEVPVLGLRQRLYAPSHQDNISESYVSYAFSLNRFPLKNRGQESHHKTGYFGNKNRNIFKYEKDRGPQILR